MGFGNDWLVLSLQRLESVVIVREIFIAGVNSWLSFLSQRLSNRTAMFLERNVRLVLFLIWLVLSKLSNRNEVGFLVGQLGKERERPGNRLLDSVLRC